MKKPLVTAVIPPEAQPGDDITLIGENLHKGDQIEIWQADTGEPERTLGKRRVRRLSSKELICALPKRLLAGPKMIVVVRDKVIHHTAGRFDVIPIIQGLIATQGSEITIKGRGFGPDSHVVIGDMDLVPDHVSSSRMSVTLPQDAALADVLAPTVRAAAPTPPLAAMDPARSTALGHGFEVKRHGLGFPNLVADQRASWGTFLETFGPAQVKQMNRLSTFFFLWAYYALYTSFFEGIGVFQASGLCSGLAALAMERFYDPTDDPPTDSIELELDDDLRKQLTVRMGRILGKQVLIQAYNQCKGGLANIPAALNALQASMAAPKAPENALMLWFLPSGRITERRFMEQLGNAHAVVPCSMTATHNPPLSRWHIPIYDVNMPGRDDVWVEVTQRDGIWHWAHNRDSRFSSDRGMTLATMPLSLFQAPAEFPFSGPFGLTRFIFDMLL